MGYVYVMEAAGYCKIGISERSVDQRRASIQTGCPFRIDRVWCSRNIPDERECERALHDYFREYNTHGEWYNVPFIKATVQADKVCRAGVKDRRLSELEELANSLECDNQRLENENAQLKAENARLKSEQSPPKHQRLCELMIAEERAKLLASENARLKSIVKRLTCLLQEGSSTDDEQPRANQ